MQPKIYSAQEHGIDANLIDSDALYILSKLAEAGHTAYLVGGSVRDLLEKIRPKDFDISTSAKPEEIKRIFHRNCLLIGRRFRLAHVRFGKKIFEVSTFRAGDVNGSDLIIQDNKWGDPEEDALRRDFTINGMFYDSVKNSVIDYVGGWDDIKKRVLRTIGQPNIRFRQDPVRMIRLLKFQARFGFAIDPETSVALIRSRDEITKSSPARVLEEILRMLESGASAPFFRLMAVQGLLDLLFPALTHFLQGKYGEDVYRYLECADVINREGSEGLLDRAVLTSCLLFPILEREIQTQFLAKGISPHMGHIITLTASMIKGVVTTSFSHFPRRMSATMGYILSTQYRLTPLSGRRHHRPALLHNKEFDLALDFLKIRSDLDASFLEDFTSWKALYRRHKQHGEKRHHAPPHHEEDEHHAEEQ